MRKGITYIIALFFFTLSSIALPFYRCPEEIKLLASDGQAGDYFGNSVSISGDYCIIGARHDDDNGKYSGSACIFVRDGNDWTLQTKLIPSDYSSYSQFGYSVSISGDYCIVGKRSSPAFIFKRNGESWSQQAKLKSSSYSDFFGCSVSISGNYCIVGAKEDDDNGRDSGAAYIFVRDGDNWIRQAKLLAGSYDRFGEAVSISGDYCIIGAPDRRDNGPGSGAAYIFKREGENWFQQAKLMAPDGGSRDRFGGAVSISGDYCIIGAPGNDGNGINSGSAYIFVREGENWFQQAKLLYSDDLTHDYLGCSVSISGNYCVAGAIYDDDNGYKSGAAYIFKRELDSWTQQVKLLPSDGDFDDRFGGSVSISDNHCIVGAHYDDDNGEDSGSAYIFNLEPTSLVDFEITGSQEVGFNCPAYYDAFAYYENGCSKNVTESTLLWVEPGNIATIDSNGLLTVNHLKKPRNITIYAQYTEGEFTFDAQMNVLVKPSRTLYIPADHQTIQDAINAAECGDTIIVTDGVYTGDGNRDIDFLGKAITVKSENGPENCIIDCEKSPCHAFFFGNGENIHSVISGFTITGCYFRKQFDKGYAIYCDGSSPTIKNCNITGNSAGYRGGIVCKNYSAPIIKNCNISDNLGSGITCELSSPTIMCCVITGNSGAFLGGGIYSTGSPVIKNCKIAGNSASDQGGGIYCNGGRPIIENCMIIGNSAGGFGGGGIMCRDNSTKINNCSLTGNWAIYGSAMKLTLCTPTISNCTINGNLAEISGGAVTFWGCFGSNAKITNCTISRNVATYAGAILCYYSSRPEIVNCTITGNSAVNFGGGILSADSSDPIINNCILWANTATLGNELYIAFDRRPSTLKVSYSDIKGGADLVHVEPSCTLIWGLGNINSDPCFVMPGYWVDINDPNVIVEPNDPNAVWVDGDYHLLPTSPCIDTGDPNYIPEPDETDFDGNPRIVNGRIDMGTYEYMPPVEVELKLTPQMLSCDSRGNWLKAHVTFPEEIHPEDIDVNTPAIAGPPGIESEFIKVNEYSDGQFDVQIYFDRQAFCEALSESEDSFLEVTVTGSLLDGQKFQGSDMIKLKSKPWQHRIRKLKR